MRAQPHRGRVRARLILAVAIGLAILLIGLALYLGLDLGWVVLALIGLLLLRNCVTLAAAPWLARRQPFELEVQAKPGRRKFARAAAVVQSIVVCVFFSALGIYFVLGPGTSHPNATPKCAGVEMSPGEVCHYRKFGTDLIDRDATHLSASDYTYDKELHRATHGNLYALIPGLLMATAGLAGLSGWTVTTIGRRLDHRRAAARRGKAKPVWKP